TSSSAQAAPVTDEPRGGDLVELPDLHDPEGAVNVAGGGGGRSSDSADSHLSLSTALPAADIDRAYGEQLLEAGWTWLPQAGSEDWALSLIQKEAGADGGEPLHGTLYTFCSELAAPVDGRFVPPGVEPGSRVCRVQIAVLAAP